MTPREAEPQERAFYRRLAHWGSTLGPDWWLDGWLRVVPPAVGAIAAAVLPGARRNVLRNLHRVRGPAPPAKDARDVLATFSTYASCVAEVLSNDAASGPRVPEATILGERWFQRAIADKRGIVMVTAHTAGWESVGPLLARDYGLRMMLVMEPEPDERARRIQDEARRRAGVAIAHVGDPLASLALLKHVQGGGVVALQLDRVVPGMRTREVELLGEKGELPEGPIRLAQLSGAPLLPVFCARTGYRRYVVEAFEPVHVARGDEAGAQAAAAHLARAMTSFLRAHPTQWFQWK